MNAAIAAQIPIDVYDVALIINAGTAGGMDPELQLFDVAISTQLAYHDVAPHILNEFHPWLKNEYFQADQRLLEASKKAAERLSLKGKIFWGRMITGKAFIIDHERDELNRRYSPLTVDMESTGIAHVCHVNQIPGHTLRNRQRCSQRRRAF